MLCYYLLLLRYDIMLGYFILFNITSWHTWLTAVYATFWILAKSPMLSCKIFWRGSNENYRIDDTMIKAIRPPFLRGILVFNLICSVIKKVENWIIPW